LKIFQKIFQVKAYLKYLFSAQNKHGLHSPFVYRWYSNLVDKQKEYYSFEALRELRYQNSKQHRKLRINDFGAGSSVNNGSSKRISSILAQAVKPESSAIRLFKMVDMAQPAVILELGTSLGLTTLYMALAKKQAKVYTLEGSPEIFEVALQNRRSLKVENIIGIEGPFHKTLPDLLAKVEHLDFVFIDGHHQKEATLGYFKMILSKLSSKAVVVVDDIHWSNGMEEAWNEIIQSDKVRISIDLYDMGVAFFDEEFKKQHFILKV
jgi:predicted O-methyltransferase YrrM